MSSERTPLLITAATRSTSSIGADGCSINDGVNGDVDGDVDAVEIKGSAENRTPYLFCCNGGQRSEPTTDEDFRVPLGTIPKFSPGFIPGPEIGLLDAKLESLDYDNCENEIYREEELKGTYNQLKFKQLARWIVSALIGMLTALVACSIDISVQGLSNLKFKLLQRYFNICTNEEGGNYCLLIPLMIWIGWNVGCVLITSILTAYGEPVSAGSGIPQIKCFLNGIKIPHVVRIKTLACKVVGVALSVVGGLAVGKEGPMIHSGAVIAAGISQGRSTTLRFDLKMFEYFRTDQEKRDFVSAGAAAGVSAAFGAPVGGVLFSLEEGASFWNQSLTWRMFFASMVSMFSLNVVLSWYEGIPWELSHPGLINFGKFQDMTYNAAELPIFVIIGIIGGLLGAAFNYINLKLTLFRKRNVSKPWMQCMEACIVALSSTLLAFLLILFTNDCQPLGQDTNSHPIQMFCPDGKSSSMATLWFQSPESSLKSLFHDVYGTYQWLTLGLFAIFYFFLACWTYGISVPSGIFIPTLVIGAAWGRLLGIFLKNLGTSNLDWINPGRFALIGAAAQLGGTVRMTLSLTVILIEATGNISFGLPLMIVLMVAKWTGDMFTLGIYDLHIQIQGIPILGWEPPPMTSNIMASEVMSHPVSTLKEIDRVGRIVEILKCESHDGFPIVQNTRRNTFSDDLLFCDSFGILTGSISRSQLIVLLRLKIRLSIDGPSDVHVPDEDFECEIDLRSFMNPAPYAVSSRTSLPRIFKLFRGLGLSHLMVINQSNELIGVVTRKDLARYRCVRNKFCSQPMLYELAMTTNSS